MRSLVLLAVACALPGWIPARAGEVALTIANSLPFERAGEPITCGVPLARGFAPSADDLILTGPGGQAVPLAAEMTGAYADGTPRWVRLDFRADLPANGSAVYRLARGGERPQPGTRLERSLRDGVARIDTGAARFTIDTRRFRLLDSVRLGGEELLGGGEGPWGILIETPAGEVLRGDASPAEAAFEDAGPLCATLCVRGALGGEGEPLRLRFVCRLRFDAGLSTVGIRFTLHNPAAHIHPGNIWDLGSGGSAFLEDFSLVLPLVAGRTLARVSGCARADERASIYQDSSGGENWRSANHADKDLRIPVSFRGYRVYLGGEEAAGGDRIDGWIHARGEKGGAAAAVREFWQNFPKALSFEEDRLRIGLWPRESAGAHEFLGGEQKTHEILLLFHGPELEEEAVRRRLAAFQRPVYAMPDPAAVLATRTFWPAAPLDRERYSRLEATCDAAVHPSGGSPETFQTRWEAIDEFGWRHFGDTFADNERAPEAMAREFPEHHPEGRPISHFVNEYDVIYTLMLQGIRRADPAWMWLADVCARHHADICVYHTGEDSPAYSHGPFMHTTHETAAFRSTFRSYPIEARRHNLRYGQGGGPNAGHAYAAALAQHYWLTGDRTSREAFLEVAEWAAESPWFSKRMMGDSRGYGNLLLILVDAYQLTSERRYYERARTLLGWIERPFAGLGGNLLAKAIGRFLDMKLERGETDPDYRSARDLLIAFGEHYLKLPASAWEGSLEQRCFHAEVLSLCCLHAPADHPRREEFRRAGIRILDEALESFPGRYVPVKTWVMCFANTGAAQRARGAGPP